MWRDALSKFAHAQAKTQPLKGFETTASKNSVDQVYHHKVMCLVSVVNGSKCGFNGNALLSF